MSSYLLIVDLSACINGVLSWVFSCANVLNGISYFLFYGIQYIWLYVDIFDSFGVEFYAGWKVWI